MKRWTNDYGDVPRWYWIVALEMRLEEYRRGLRDGAVLGRPRAVLMAIAAMAAGFGG